MAEKKIDPREELSQKVEQCLTVQDIHKKVTPIWHALIVSGTHCCVNQTIGRET